MPSIAIVSCSSGPNPAAALAPGPPTTPTRSVWDSEIHKAALAHDLERCQWLVTLHPSLLEARGFNGYAQVR